MDKEETIRMAEQAGFVIDQKSKQFQPNCISATHHVIDEQLTRFEALVRADERKRNLELVEILVEAEREACAKVCDEIANNYDGSPAGTGADNCAEVIRARGQE